MILVLILSLTRISLCYTIPGALFNIRVHCSSVIPCFLTTSSCRTLLILYVQKSRSLNSSFFPLEELSRLLSTMHELRIPQNVFPICFPKYCFIVGNFVIPSCSLLSNRIRPLSQSRSTSFPLVPWRM